MEVKRRKHAPEVRRGEILQSARCVFAQKGFAEANVDDIAAKAGVAKGTLYLYFTSKEQIFMAALLEDARQLDEMTRARMAQAPCWQGKIRAYVHVRLEYLDSHLDFLRIFLGEIRGKMLRGAPMCSDFFQVTRDSEGLLAQVIAAAVARGEVRDIDPELAGITIVDMTRGLMERRLLGRCHTDPLRDTDFLLDLIWHALERRDADSCSESPASAG
jgi:AcrR family transcriptional regulator